MIELNFESAALILTSLCLIYSLTVNRKQYRLAKGLKNNLLNCHVVFILQVISLTITTMASVGAACLDGVEWSGTRALRYTLDIVYYLSHAFLSVGFALYIMDITGACMGRSRRFFVFYSLPCMLSVLLILTNPFTGACFSVDAQGMYSRGPWLPVLYACGLLYVMTSFAFFLRHIRAISRTDRIEVCALVLMSALGVVIQGLHQELAVELFAESLALLGIMVMLEERGGYIDPLTGVLNRTALMDAGRLLIETGQNSRLILVKLTNLDVFAKLFTGREIDSLILQVSDWLAETAKGYELYHYRDRDFAIVLPDDQDQSAEALSDVILQRFGTAWETDRVEFKLEAEICVICIQEDLQSLNDLHELLVTRFQNAGGGTRRVTYDEVSTYRRNRRFERALRDAVENKKLRLWYQPIWSTEEGRTVAAEALLRIDSEEFRGISPEVYIPVAEQCGIIREIGLFVFEEVCRFLRDRDAKRLGLSYVDVNLSVHQFLYDDLTERFEEIRQRYGVPREAIDLEITESASVTRTPAVEQALEKLRSIGYHLSLDDFGTGYSNMVQLIRTHYKNVKIDKSLLWDAEHNATTARVLDNLIRVIRSLGCNVVQEGVETPAQLERSANSGANLIQGYYFSRPMPEQDFVDYMTRDSSRPGTL